MPVRLLLPALLLPAVLLLGAPAAVRAEGGVPDVAADDLPVAGTCAPLDTTDVTRVLAGAEGGFRVDGAPTVLDEAGLTAALKQKAGGRPGLNRHSVWVTMSAAQPFLPLVELRRACMNAGVFRLGLEVRSEDGAPGFGFPLFLPGNPPTREAGAPAPKGRRLALELDRWEGAESNPRRLYAAAVKAAQSSAPLPVVAEVSLDANLSVQHVVTCLDMLYRGGVAGVRVKFRSRPSARISRGYEGPDSANARPGAARETIPLHLIARIVVSPSDKRPLGPTEPVLALPPAAPRKAPWSDDGAEQPGAFTLELEDLVAPANGPREEEDEGPLPSYAGRREGVPTQVVVTADRAVAAWSAKLGRVLGDALNRKWALTEHFVQRLRDVDKLGAAVSPLVEMFPGTTKVVPSTLRLDVYLVRGVSVVGKVETTLHIGGSAMSLVFARWVVEDFPTGLNLPPAAADPFAAGVPGHVRVWLEAAFNTVYRQGAAGLPLAPENEVLAQLPTVAHENSRRSLGARAAEFDVLSKWLQVTEYDRLLVLPRGATAAVHAGGRVAGILSYGIESEDKELRLLSLTGRAAPR